MSAERSKNTLLRAVSRGAVWLALLGLFTLPLRAQETRLLSDDGAAGDQLGGAVALSGDYAIAGAAFQGGATDNFGAAYIFFRASGGWTQQAQLTASDAGDDDRFGFAVDIDGDYAVVGAIADDDGGTNAGAVYVFVREGTTWTEQAKLTAADPQDDHRFGGAVAISGSHVLVGAFGDDAVRTDGGAAYVFVREGTTWTQQAKLTAADAVNGDAFGNAVALDGTHAVIGAVGDNFPSGVSGSAYVFVREGTTWTEQTKLAASDGGEDNFFGNAVAISGDYIVVGMSEDDDEGDNAGSAYVFVREGTMWTEQTKLTAGDAAAGDEFGYAVALDGPYAVVTARSRDADTGAAYVFLRSGTTWTAQSTLTASDAEAGDEFGYAAALSGTTALIGARYDDAQGNRAGSAYVIELVTTGTAIEQHDGEVPTAYRLDPNYPNPFNPATTLSFGVPQAAHVTLTVYDATGATVATLVDQRLTAGQYTTSWDATGLASGVYLARMQAGGVVQTRPMVLLK